MNNNEKRSFPNADDLMRFMENHMLGVDGAKHNLRREIFWSSEQVENAIRAYFESMPKLFPVGVCATTRFNSCEVRHEYELDERVAAEIGRQIMANPSLYTIRINDNSVTDPLGYTHSVRVELYVLPNKE